MAFKQDASQDLDMAPVITARLLVHEPDKLVIRTDFEGFIKDLYYLSNKPLWCQEFRSHDFVAVSLSHYAAALGADLVIEGPLSSSQLKNLDQFLQIWAIWRPDLFKRISISGTSEIEDTQPSTKNAVLAFSGGVDSSFSLLAHRIKILGRQSQNIDLGILMIGFDIRLGDSAGAKRGWELAEEALSSCDANCAIVETNWKEDFCCDWLMSHIVPMSGILQSLHTTHAGGIISSDLSYLQEFAVGPFGNSVATNHLLGSANFPILTSSGTYTRFEKIKLLIDHPVLSKTIRSCYMENAGGGNCGHCRKCILTQMAIIALGRDPSQLFPEQMTKKDIENISISSHSLIYLEEAAAMLPKAHELYDILMEVIEREKKRLFPSITSRRLGERIAFLEHENLRLRQREADLIGSTSWRITSPLRKAKKLFNKTQEQEMAYTKSQKLIPA